MHINQEQLQYWMDNFYGYGSWQAKFWFISHEDGGGDLPEEVAEKLVYFYNQQNKSNQPTLCDIRDLYRHASMYADGPKGNIYSNLYEYRFGNRARLSGVWKNLISFISGIKDEEIPDLLTYQQNLFASVSLEKEALIKLYPLPGANHHGWYYSWLDMPGLPFLKSRALYEQHFYTNRMDTILLNLIQHKPEVVLMYGMNNINGLKKSVQQYFPSASFKMIKAIKGKIPQHHRAELPETTLLITTQVPALRHNRIETGFDWLAFGMTVNNK